MVAPLQIPPTCGKVLSLEVFSYRLEEGYISEPICARSTKVVHCVHNTISHLCAKFQGPSHFLSAGGGIYHILGGWIDSCVYYNNICMRTEPF